MNIKKFQDDNTVILKLEGWLDTQGAPALGETVDGIVSADAIMLDFDGVEYMASAGLRQVVAAYKKAEEINSDFSVINVNDEVMSIFSMTGIDKKLKVIGK